MNDLPQRSQSSSGPSEVGDVDEDGKEDSVAIVVGDVLLLSMNVICKLREESDVTVEGEISIASSISRDMSEVGELSLEWLGLTTSKTET